MRDAALVQKIIFAMRDAAWAVPRSGNELLAGLSLAL